MKKLLSRLPEQRLRDLARDFSLQDGTRTEVVAAMAGYFRSYGLTTGDLIARHPDLKQWSQS